MAKKRRAELEQFGKVKEQDDGTVSLNLRKNAVKADGSAARPISVVDEAGDEVAPMSLGNGSTGNVMVMARDYEIKNPKTGKVTKSGTSLMLNKVQVIDHVVYEGGNGEGFVDFDYNKEQAKAASKKAAADSAEEEQDEEGDNVESVEFTTTKKAAPAKAAAKKAAPAKSAAKKASPKGKF